MILLDDGQKEDPGFVASYFVRVHTMVREATATTSYGTKTTIDWTTT